MEIYKKLSLVLLFITIFLFLVTFHTKNEDSKEMKKKVIHPSAVSVQINIQDILEKDFKEWSTEEYNLFIQHKRHQYSDRQSKIKEICKQKPSKFPQNMKKMNLIYDLKDEVSYCAIAKVASSTWCQHFIDLANVTKKEKEANRGYLQGFAPKLWPPPRDPVDLVEAWSKTTSMVIVRHPLARIASVYYQKFVELATTNYWAPGIRRIIDKYRPDPLSGDQVHCSPEEMVRFVLDSLKDNPNAVDEHWRPQYQQCPFCQLDFTVYARVEEMAEDTIFFLTTTSLMDRVDTSIKLNDKHKIKGVGKSPDQDFWQSVDIKYIKMLEEPWAYKMDLETFGYNIEDYLQSIGLTVDYNRPLLEENFLQRAKLDDFPTSVLGVKEQKGGEDWFLIRNAKDEFLTVKESFDGVEVVSDPKKIKKHSLWRFEKGFLTSASGWYLSVGENVGPARTVAVSKSKKRRQDSDVDDSGSTHILCYGRTFPYCENHNSVCREN